MHVSCVVGVRIAVSLAAVAGLVFIQFAASSSSYASNATVYAVDLTSSPASTPAGAPLFQLTPTPIATPAVVAQPAQATASSQQASDRIAQVSQQVADAAHDPALSVDTKVERINALATQFNQLVAQWQQQLPQGVAAGAATPVPVAASLPAAATPAPNSPSGIIPAPPLNSPPSSGVPTTDQLRSQIATISQQMAQIAQDPSLSGDAKTAQLAALGAQFNQLMIQLQQRGG